MEFLSSSLEQEMLEGHHFTGHSLIFSARSIRHRGTRSRPWSDRSNFLCQRIAAAHEFFIASDLFKHPKNFNGSKLFGSSP